MSGYRNDGDAGIMQVGARYYDPATGSFLTMDTDLSQLAYVYCGDDPINDVDPSGHFSLPHYLRHWFIWGGGIIAVGGGIITLRYPSLGISIASVGMMLNLYGSDPKPVDRIITYIKHSHPVPLYDIYSEPYSQGPYNWNLMNKYSNEQ